MISQEDYLKLRESTLKDLKEFISLTGGSEITFLTCDDCPARFDCKFAADGYNTNGDCLAEK